MKSECLIYQVHPGGETGLHIDSRTHISRRAVWILKHKCCEWLWGAVAAQPAGVRPLHTPALICQPPSPQPRGARMPPPGENLQHGLSSWACPVFLWPLQEGPLAAVSLVSAAPSDGQCRGGWTQLGAGGGRRREGSKAGRA